MKTLTSYRKKPGLESPFRVRKYEFPQQWTSENMYIKESNSLKKEEDHTTFKKVNLLINQVTKKRQTTIIVFRKRNKRIIILPKIDNYKNYRLVEKYTLLKGG